MQNSIITNYRLLTDKIADKYGLIDQVIFIEKKDFLHRSKASSRELSDNALQWLATMIHANEDGLDQLIEGVNAINREQRNRFTDHYKESKSLTYSFIVLN